MKRILSCIVLGTALGACAPTVQAPRADLGFKSSVKAGPGRIIKDTFGCKGSSSDGVLRLASQHNRFAEQWREFTQTGECIRLAAGEEVQVEHAVDYDLTVCVRPWGHSSCYYTSFIEVRHGPAG